MNLLIAAGANVKAATRYNITPLSLACTNGNATVIERLLAAGANPNSTSEEGQTVLMTAALTGKVDAIKVLLTHGAIVNAREPYKGQTALMWAASEGNAAAAAMLIEFGADVRGKSDGVSASSPGADALPVLGAAARAGEPAPPRRRPARLP